MSTSTPAPGPLLERFVEGGAIPGGVIALGPDPEPVAAGALAVGGEPMPVDAIFRIQSMTKLITTVAALRCVEQGVLTLDAPVATWLPELAEPRVLQRPDAELEDTVPARGPITLRHLLTNTSGYGMILEGSPLQRAMAGHELEAGPLPPTLGAEDWLAELSALPLVGQPGEVWRYHHSFGLLGILLSRLHGMSTGEHLEQSLFAPLGMTSTGYHVPREQAHRLPAAYAAEAEAGGGEGPGGGEGGVELVELEPAGGGFHVGPPPYDMSHSELLSTAPDYLRFLRSLRDGELIGAEHLAMLGKDQTPQRVKAPKAFFPGFWDRTGWGLGVGVTTDGPHRGRWGWSGGAGTDFFVDPGGSLGIVLTQVEMGPRIAPLLEAYGEL